MRTIKHLRALGLLLCVAGGAFAQDNRDVARVLLDRVDSIRIQMSAGAQNEAGAASSGSVASLVVAFPQNNQPGNSIVVACGVGNSTQPTISDTRSNTYSAAVFVANGSAFGTGIFYATNGGAGANTVTCTNGGAAASMAIQVWEVRGTIRLASEVLDATNSGTGTSTALSSGAVSPRSPSEYAFAAFGVGTAAQTITVGSSFTNDSGQLNPATPAGLFSFAAASRFLADMDAVTATATITSEPWSAVIATFRPITVPVSGMVGLLGTANTTGSLLTHYLTSAASTNSTSVKGTPGNVYSYAVINTTSTLYYLRMYNLTTAPTCSSATGFVGSFPVPHGTGTGAGFVLPIDLGQAFTTGIGYCLTAGGGSTDNTAAAVGVYIWVLYQ